MLLAFPSPPAPSPAPLCPGGFGQPPSLSMPRPRWGLAEASVHTALPTPQAEGWVRGKLRDLKDGCDLQGWEQVAQTLQREMKDFENTLIKLSQVRPGCGAHPVEPPRALCEPPVTDGVPRPADGRAADVQAEPRRRGGAEAAAGPAGAVAAPEADGRQPEPGPGRAAQPAGLQQESGAARGLDPPQGAGSGRQAACPGGGLPRPPPLLTASPCPRRRSPAWRPSCRKARTRSSSPAASST